MTKKNRTMKKVAAMAASIHTEQDEINKALEAEMTPKSSINLEKAPAIRRTVILPEGVSGKKLIAQTSLKAAELNPNLKPIVDKAKEAAKDGLEPKKSIIAKAREVKAEKAEKSGKKVKTVKVKAAKYTNNITSMEALGDYCLQEFGEDAKHKETVKIFTDAYIKKNGLTVITPEMKAFMGPRIVIYLNIAKKKAAKIATAAKAEADAKKAEKKSAKETVK